MSFIRKIIIVVILFQNIIASAQRVYTNDAEIEFNKLYLWLNNDSTFIIFNTEKDSQYSFGRYIENNQKVKLYFDNALKPDSIGTYGNRDTLYLLIRDLFKNRSGSYYSIEIGDSVIRSGKNGWIRIHKNQVINNYIRTIDNNAHLSKYPASFTHIMVNPISLFNKYYYSVNYNYDLPNLDLGIEEDLYKSSKGCEEFLILDISNNYHSSFITLYNLKNKTEEKEILFKKVDSHISVPYLLLNIRK